MPYKHTLTSGESYTPTWSVYTTCRTPRYPSFGPAHYPMLALCFFPRLPGRSSGSPPPEGSILLPRVLPPPLSSPEFWFVWVLCSWSASLVSINGGGRSVPFLSSARMRNTGFVLIRFFLEGSLVCFRYDFRWVR
jgi:hypothetical protein